MFYRILQDFIRKSRGTSVLTDTRIVTEPIQSPCYTRPTTNQLPSNELKNPTGNHSGRAVIVLESREMLYEPTFSSSFSFGAMKGVSFSLINWLSAGTSFCRI